MRVPFLDYEFVEWGMRLPPSLKLRGQEGKWVVKKALEPIVPGEILYRRKQGFSVPLAAWFRGPFADGFARQLGEGGLEEYFDLGFAGRLLERHRTGLSDNSRTLWLLWMFNGFLKRQGH